LPGAALPFSPFGGVLFAVCFSYALAKKGCFQPLLLVSPRSLAVISLLLCCLPALRFVPAVLNFLSRSFGIAGRAAAVVAVLLFLALNCLVLLLLQQLTAPLVTRGERRGHLLKNFSAQVAQTLQTGVIIQKLGEVLTQAMDAETAYILLKEENDYPIVSHPNLPSSFAFDSGYASVQYFQNGGAHLLFDDFSASPIYAAACMHERRIYEALDIQCALPLNAGSELAGLVLLPRSARKRAYSLTEMDYLGTVCSIASIALRNAVLYENLYREARVDSLTGVYSFKYFIEKTQEDFAACGGGQTLALLYLDIDDMKLYNQLYGPEKGDYVLKVVANIIEDVVRAKGTIFRHSGKVFAGLLPGLGAEETRILAKEIQLRVRAQTGHELNGGLSPVTLSAGICVSPDAASSAAELIENADIAVFNAKNSGKGRISVFKPITVEAKQITERVMQVIEEIETKGKGSYANYSSTVMALTAAIDAKDHYTYTHSQNVAYYSCVLATAAGLNNYQIRLVYEAALLHDIGKISIPEAILGKTMELTPDEKAIMDTHVNNSIEMIRHLPSMDYVIPVAVAHHEWWDGSGYPRGIQGEDIPIAARCLAIADSFDAITSNRPYRKSCTLAYALEQVESNVGKQFDPYLSQVFISLIHRGEIHVRAPQQP
jgi:diguanylate cyclase (GGDEF)-like protein/putative nucleotidyltransferase with HDIG domain